jgi:hypothetical protein
MHLSADVAAEIRFRGTRYAYDRREVDRFRERVIDTLRAYEAAVAAAEERIRELERSQSHRPSRLRSRVVEDAVGSPPGEYPPESFRRWHADMASTDAAARIRSMALEEARMIRAVAAEQAEEEIERLTDGARLEALEVTRRAARLAGQTEEEARVRADAILDATIRNPDVDVDDLARRIDDLRSGIAAVQARLQATAEPEGEAVTVDLRKSMAEEASPAVSGGTRKKDRRSRRQPVPTTAELEVKAAELRKRLDPD